MDDDPVALITGASSGIGSECASSFEAAGYRVALASRSVDPTLTTERSLSIPMDVRSWESVSSCVSGVLDRFGRIDTVFACAGIGAARGFRNESVSVWRDLVLTNLYGAALTIRACSEPLIASRGHLLLIASVAGRSMVSGSLYAAVAAGVAGLAESARLELAGSGVRVTLLVPGIVHTPFYDNPQADALHPSDIAAAALSAVSAPAHVDVSELVLRPVAQRLP